MSTGNKISIKTQVGFNEQSEIEDTIMQGETISSTLCTATMGQIEKDCELKPFQYKNEVEIPKMGFVDDTLDINKCGKEAKDMNKYTNDEINKRKLQLNQDKCKRIHVSKNKTIRRTCEDLHIDSWETEKIEDEEGIKLVDKHVGTSKIKTVEKAEYLGSIITYNGSNKETIQDRISKSLGNIRDISHIPQNMHFGKFQMNAFKLLRHTMIDSILTYNLEVMHNLSKQEVKSLDKVDMTLIR